MRIEGSVALVTGANRGLGKAFTEALLAAGAAKVYAAVRDPASITDARLVPVPLDVTSPTQIKAASRACPDVTLLINNAGIMLLSPVLAEGAEEALRQEMETNVYGPLALARAFAPILAHNGGGALVNMLSVVSWFTNPFNATYCASKHAALAVTDALRIQLYAQGTQVCGVYAGFIDTSMAAEVGEAKASPRQIAVRVLEGVQAGESHILADTAARDISAALQASPHALEAAMQHDWDQGASPWSI
ncbi:SDR family oxidoreductase [Acidocella facilis]|uniref:SDR family oxidoreductase n=1 Tax=Acidocella facilis TaxID=525 RepID=UPI00047D8413|nr:SDR family oxidoreductase [Acidocella facilis]